MSIYEHPDPFRKHPNQNMDDVKGAMVTDVKVHAELLLKALSQMPDGREKTLAATKLEESVMWAVKGLTA